MAEKTFRARVVLVSPDIPDDDLGDKLITLRIIEEGRFYAFFEHDGKQVQGSVADISPLDWEQTGVTPTVRVVRSAGGP